MNEASGVNRDVPVYVCNEFLCRTFSIELWFTALKLNLVLLKKTVPCNSVMECEIKIIKSH